jgi:hypothetical protein
MKVLKAEEKRHTAQHTPEGGAWRRALRGASLGRQPAMHWLCALAAVREARASSPAPSSPRGGVSSWDKDG